jgi:hypothetical protein
MSGSREQFSSIILGKTPFLLKGEVVYAKHYGFHDGVETDFVYSIELEKAREAGIDSEDERLLFLYREGIWSEEKEKKIESLRRSISRETSSKRNILLPSKKEEVNRNIKKMEVELYEILSERSNLIGKTQEFFAKQESEIFFILNTIYKDSNLSELYIPKDKHDETEQDDVYELIGAYNESVSSLMGGGVKKVALSSECQTLTSLAESAYEFYGKPVSTLTFFQSELYIYAKNYTQMLNYEIAPSSDIASDPDRLEDWFSSVTNSKKVIGDSSGNVSLVGATAEDIKQITGGQEVRDMDSEIKKAALNNNGIVDMETLMRLHG